MVKIKRSTVAGTLSLTPLIDVVFLLLIFFLVTSEFEEDERRLDIILPTASTAVPMTSKPREIIVDIGADGEMYLHGQATPMDELRRLMTIAVGDNPTNQSVVIRADHRASFQPVVSVMDLCNQTGISNCSVTTKPPSGGDASL